MSKPRMILPLLYTFKGRLLLGLAILICASAQAEKIDTRQITYDSRSIIVPKEWMEDYRALSQLHGTIPADSLIWKEGKKYHIPFKVAKRYLELKKKPQPTY